MKKRNMKTREDKNRILIKAFWSGRMDYRKWRRIIRNTPEGHRKTFYQSFLHLPMRWLLKEIGTERFVKIWPLIRYEFRDTSAADWKAKDGWDALWGMITVGDSQYPVTPQVSGLSRKRREIMRLIVRTPGISFYEIAKETKRDYSRVYKDISLLKEMGMVNSIEKKDSIRKIRQLIPVHSVNAILAGFQI
jgi:DNA-binding transcriptional ArsR family regulator